MRAVGGIRTGSVAQCTMSCTCVHRQDEAHCQCQCQRHVTCDTYTAIVLTRNYLVVETGWFRAHDVCCALGR